jgi:O-antigen ligase
VNPPLATGELAAARVIAFALAAFLVVAPVSGSSGLRVGLLVIATLAVGHVAYHYGRTRLCGPPPAWLGGLFAGWAALAAASLLWSVDVPYTISELRREILYATLTFAAFFLGASEFARVRLWCMALLGGTSALVIAEIVRGLFTLDDIPWNSGPGRFSTHLVTVAPLLVTLVAARPLGLGQNRTWFLVLVAVFFVGAMATQNRITWAAFLASLIVLGTALAPWAAVARRRAVFAAVLSLGIAICALFAVSLVHKAEEAYPTAANAGESLAMDQRPQIWSIALRAISERPALGYGYGREILEKRFRAEIGERGYEFATHGHNIFVNAAVSLGLAGALLLAGLLAALTVEHLRNLRREQTRLAGAIGLAILAGFLVKNLTDDFFNRHNALVFWALNGMLVGFGRRPGAVPT